MIYLLIPLAILAIFGLGILVGALHFQVEEKLNRFPPDPEIEKLPRCTCAEVNLCDTWCRSKALFVKHPPED
jgi:hypothetical protein